MFFDGVILREQFWSCKFAANVNLSWKRKINKKIFFFIDKKIIKFDDTKIETEKKKIHQQESTISVNNIDINKTVVCNKILLVIRMVKKYTLNAYFF